MTRILGLDLGERRIGVAVADGDGGRAMPLTTLKRASHGGAAADVAALRRIVVEQSASEVVVGLPLEASGIEGPQARLTRTWVDAVTPLLGVPVALRDERLSSHLAEQRVGPMKRGRSGGPPTRSQREAYRARIDREAAAIILQDELDARDAAATGRHQAGEPR
ncbi:MAG: Holliday junction resolvase RuvX [Chloroflexota bacterium]